VRSLRTECRRARIAKRVGQARDIL